MDVQLARAHQRPLIRDQDHALFGLELGEGLDEAPQQGRLVRDAIEAARARVRQDPARLALGVERDRALLACQQLALLAHAPAVAEAEHDRHQPARL